MKRYMLIILLIFSLISKSYCTVPYFHTEKSIINERKSTSTTSTKSEKSTQSERIILEYGKGKFWDGLKSSDKSAKANKTIKTDGKYFYAFDKMHKEHGIHLHKYQKEGKFYRLIENVDPES